MRAATRVRSGATRLTAGKVATMVGGSSRARGGAVYMWAALVLVGVAAGWGETATFFYPTASRQQRQSLTASSDYLLILTKAGRTSAEVAGAVRANAPALSPQPIAAWPRQRLLAFRIAGSAAQAQAEVDRLSGTTAVQARLTAYSSTPTPPSGPNVVETSRLCLGLLAGGDINALCTRYGLQVLGPLTALEGTSYLVEVLHPEDRAPTLVANDLVEQEPSVRYCHDDYFLKTTPYGRPQPVASRQIGLGLGEIPLATVNDPLFAQQWHLRNTGQGGGTPGADINALAAWDYTFGSASCLISVLDTGIDVTHEDLNVGNKVFMPYNFDDGNTNVNPNPNLDGTANEEDHGTATSGVATAAGNNGIGVSGAAPGCRLIPEKMMMSDLANIAAAFDWARTQGAWVCSNSWGWGGISVTPQVVADSITALATNGRGGLGCAVLVAAGNGDGTNPNQKYNDFGFADTNPPANYRDCWSVVASDYNDVHLCYSDTGNTVLIAAPSGVFPPAAQGGIVTTDRMGAVGYDRTNYTYSFNGTSSACPLAAGVVALMMSLDPTRTATEIKGFLTSSAQKIDQGNGNYDSNGHSRFYGYGRTDAKAALDLVAAGLGTPVTVGVSTKGLGTSGIVAMTRTTPIQVSYTLRNRVRTVNVWDGQTVQIGCDPGTTVTFGQRDTAGSSSMRWYSAAPVSRTVGNTALTLSGEYYLQLQRNFRIAVQTGAVAVDAAHPVTATTVFTGTPQSTDLTSAGSMVWSDAGSTYNIAVEANNEGTSERWQAADINGDGTPDAPTGTMTTRVSEVAPLFYHLVRPLVKLNGTSHDNTVSVSKRKVLGADALQASVSGTYQDFCDEQSALSFAAQSDSTPKLAVDGQREFTVTPALNAVVNYIVQPQPSTSGVSVSRASAPANGRTTVDVTVTVRDSASGPVSGIVASRLDVRVSPTDGVKLTNPTGATDSLGRLVFTLTCSQPGTVTVSAVLDGLTIGSTAQVQFLPVLTVPFSLPGVYFVSFPVTPANSDQLISDFGVTPQPAQLARLLDGTTTYDFYHGPGTGTSFGIEPGKGFFLRTSTAGSAELTGTWSSGSTFTFAMAKAGFHQLGNPQISAVMVWRMADFEVFLKGVSQGLLSTASAQACVNPVGWTYNGLTYEMAGDPLLPGASGLRNAVNVFEGFFWRSLKDNVSVVYTPNSGRSRAAEPISPVNCGFTLLATADGQTSRVILGAQRQATRSDAAPPLPDGDGAVALEIVTSDGGRAAADWVGHPISLPTTWTVAARTKVAGRQVTLNWPSLNRQMPAGSRVRLTDPTTGRSLLLNTHSSYSFVSGSSERLLQLTMLPRSESGLQILQFSPGTSRGRSVVFDVGITGEAELVLRVTGLGGQLVTETAPVRASGATTVAWDGLTADGRVLPRGTYQVTLVARNDAGETVRAVRMVTLR